MTRAKEYWRIPDPKTNESRMKLDESKLDKDDPVDDLISQKNKRFRTLVAQGKELFLHHVDMRTLPARRFREVYYDTLEDMGGEGYVSAKQKYLARRIAAMEAIAEAMECAWVSGRGINLAEYLSLTNTMNRVINTLGVQRTKKDITPVTLQDFMKQGMFEDTDE